MKIKSNIVFPFYSKKCSANERANTKNIQPPYPQNFPPHQNDFFTEISHSIPQNNLIPLYTYSSAPSCRGQCTPKNFQRRKIHLQSDHKKFITLLGLWDSALNEKHYGNGKDKDFIFIKFYQKP